MPTDPDLLLRATLTVVAACALMAASLPSSEPFAITPPSADNPAMFRKLFSFEFESSVAQWNAIDDVVMGGVSHSRIRHDPAGHAVFEGTVSLENNGGFASVRSRPQDLSAPGAIGYVVEARGDGKRYKLTLRTDDAFDAVNYQASFDAPAGTWTLVHVPLAEFRASFRGRPVPGAPALDPARVRQIGPLLRRQVQLGPAFRLA